MTKYLSLFITVLFLSACRNEKLITEPVYSPIKIKKPVTIPTHPPAGVPDSVCIAAVGDIMMGTSYPNKNTLPPDSGKYSFKNVMHQLRDADVTFGNLEGTLLDTGNPAHYKMHLHSKGYLFRMPVSYGKLLKDAGFNVLSLANNHVGDFGEAGRTNTMSVLDSAGIHYGGQLSHPSAVFKIHGITYGFCAFAPNSQTLPLLDLQNARHIIHKLKLQCDIVIVSFHGGGEGAGFEHVPFKGESFHNEKRGNVHAFAHNAIDAGADIIFGNGPHVCRGMEVYKNRLIAYSLGNFCTYRSVSVAGICGIAPLVKVYVNKKGEFLSGHIIAVKQSHDKGLESDTQNRAVYRIRLLTKTDFPQSGISISDEGWITRVGSQPINSKND